MRKTLATAVAALAGAVLLGSTGAAQTPDTYDYWQHQRQMVRYGQQAIFMCNGLFTSHRTLEQVYQPEVEVGSPSPAVQAAWR